MRSLLPMRNPWPHGVTVGLLLLPCLILGYHQGAASSSSVLVAAADSTDDVKRQAAHVCDGRNDHVTIQEALDAVGETGVVRLAAGNYHVAGTITMPLGVSLIGAGSEVTILDINGLIKISSYYGQSPVPNHIHVPWDNVRLEGLQLTGSGWVRIQANHVKLVDVMVKDSFLTPHPSVGRISAQAAFGIDLPNRDLTDIHFLRCVAENVGTSGFRFDSTMDINQYEKTGGPRYTLSNVTLIECRAIRCGSGVYPDNRQGWHFGEAYAVGFDMQEFINLRGLIMEDCRAIDNWMDGIHFEARGANVDYGDNLVRNCISKDNGQRKLAKWGMAGVGFGVNYHGGRGVTFDNCYSENGARAGFMGVQMHRTILRHCTDVGSQHGFYFTGAGRQYSDIRLEDCTSENAKTYGLLFSLMTNAIIRKFCVAHAGGDGTYLNMLGQELYYGSSFAGPVDYSAFQIHVTGNDNQQIPLRENGTGNTYEHATP
jgi:hypothetical protein